ncbi:MAG: cell division protein FtsQ/DivIB [Ruminococcus sp.]
MKDVEKTSIERENSIKRLRRRKRSMGIYGLLVIIAVLGLGITLSCTWLFNLNEVTFLGDSDRYSADDIIEKAELKAGENLIKMDKEEKRQKLLSLTYVEDAKVSVNLPSTLEIEIIPCIPSYNISYELGTILISEKGKILETSEMGDNGLPTFYGYEPLSPAIGSTVDTNDERQKEVFEEFIRVLNQREDKNKIASVNMENRSNVIIKFRDGNVFKMGDWNDFEYKLTLAERVIEETGKVGYITMVGTNQCSFRMTDGGFESSVVATQPADVQTATSTETTTSVPEPETYTEPEEESSAEDYEYSDEEYSDYQDYEDTYEEPYEDDFYYDDDYYEPDE